MKSLLAFLLTLLLSTTCLSVQSPDSRLDSQESEFLKSFRSASSVDKLLHESAKGIDSIMITGDSESDSLAVNGTTTVRNRGFEVEIYKINASENFDLLNKIKNNLEQSLTTHNLQYKVFGVFPEGFRLRYSSSCTVGHIDVRGMYKEDKSYYLSLIFNESVCTK